MSAAIPYTLVCFMLCLLPASSLAASRTLKAGEVLGVSEDIVLSGDDVLEVQGTAVRLAWSPENNRFLHDERPRGEEGRREQEEGEEA